MAKAPDPLAEYVVDQLRNWAPVTPRRLFSGWGIYRGPAMLALIMRDTIYFRVDENNLPDYEAVAAKPFVHSARKCGGVAPSGAQPFRYTSSKGKIVSMPYYEVPADVLEEPEELARWAEKAHARSAQGRPKKTSEEVHLRYESGVAG